MTKMTNWLTRHYWIAALLVVLFALTWLFVLVPAYQDCHIAEIDRILKDVEAIRSEREAILRQINLLLGGDSDVEVLRLQGVADELERHAADEFAKTWRNVKHFAIVILGVCLQLMLAGCLVYLFNRYFYNKLVFRKLLGNRKKRSTKFEQQ